MENDFDNWDTASAGAVGGWGYLALTCATLRYLALPGKRELALREPRLLVVCSAIRGPILEPPSAKPAGTPQSYRSAKQRTDTTVRVIAFRGPDARTNGFDKLILTRGGKSQQPEPIRSRSAEKVAERGRIEPAAFGGRGGQRLIGQVKVRVAVGGALGIVFGSCPTRFQGLDFFPKPCRAFPLFELDRVKL